jgi:hexosaminidase
MIDAVSPESDTARQFRDLVETFIQSGYKDQVAETQIRAWLTAWRDNNAKLHALLDQSFLLREDAPLSADLSALGAAGLQSLDYLDKSQPSPDSWRAQTLARIEEAKKRKADLLLMPVASVQQLVEATGGPTRH